MTGCRSWKVLRLGLVQLHRCTDGKTMAQRRARIAQDRRSHYWIQDWSLESASGISKTDYLYHCLVILTHEISLLTWHLKKRYFGLCCLVPVRHLWSSPESCICMGSLLQGKPCLISSHRWGSHLQQMPTPLQLPSSFPAMVAFLVWSFRASPAFGKIWRPVKLAASKFKRVFSAWWEKFTQQVWVQGFLVTLCDGLRYF